MEIMIIQCEQCKTRFRIDDSKIRSTGSKVRCSKCGNMFFVTRGEEKKEPSFESEDFSQTVEKSVGEQEAAPQEKEIPMEFLPPQEELKIDSEEEKEPIGGFNWEKFSVGREEKETTPEPPHSMKTEESLEVEKKEEHAGFSWENLSVEKEPVETLVEPPRLFSETPQETELLPKESGVDQESKSKPVTPIKPTPDMLMVDKEKLLVTQKQTLKESYPYSPTVRLSEQTSKGSTLKKITSALIKLLILLIIIGAAVAIAINLELIPKDKADRITGFILSKLPKGLIQQPGDDVVVSDHSSRWVSTKNGFIYVVSGNITNKSKYAVNYIRIKSEFMSGGERLFEQVVYAGNTLTENELKTLPFGDILLKLNRKNGDISFDNPRKLAGLNYSIQPNESVPFFTVFPSKSRILGLKYNIEIVDLEKIPLG